MFNCCTNVPAGIVSLPAQVKSAVPSGFMVKSTEKSLVSTFGLKYLVDEISIPSGLSSISAWPEESVSNQPTIL